MVAHSRTPLRTDRVRALNLPSAVEVEIGADGLPTAIVEDRDGAEGRKGGRADGGSQEKVRRGGSTQAVRTVVESWRIDDEWWRQPIHRRYVEVVLEGGAHVVLFEDEVTNEWFVQMP